MSKKSQEQTAEAVAPVAVPSQERLSDQDKLTLDLVKSKQELAREKARSAMTSVELADQHYQNFVMTLAMRYRLVDGDVIEENGNITRK
jgi:hypothetical protein